MSSQHPAHSRFSPTGRAASLGREAAVQLANRAPRRSPWSAADKSAAGEAAAAAAERRHQQASAPQSPGPSRQQSAPRSPAPARSSSIGQSAGSSPSRHAAPLQRNSSRQGLHGGTMGGAAAARGVSRQISASSSTAAAARRRCSQSPSPPSPSVSRQSSTDSVGGKQRGGSGGVLLLTSSQDAAAVQLPQQTTAASSSSSSAWAPAGKCWQTLGLMGPLRDALVACVGEPRHTAGVAPSQPRLSPAGSKLPKDHDMKKLLDATASMASSLAELRALLGVAPAPSPGADAGTGGASSSEVAAAAAAAAAASSTACGHAAASSAGACSVAEPVEPEGLKEEIGRLQKEVVRLEAQAVQVDDLEQVAAQLRSRVSELKEKEARAVALRSECRELRVEIAGLVAASVHSESFEAGDKAQSQLHSSSSFQAKRPEDLAKPCKTSPAASSTTTPANTTRSLPGHVDGSTGSSCGPVPRSCANQC
eukprot:TRINITY_DN18729_c0_g1_i1.p1 TRINITY_DN18729_c0_g1~~TRINITY_DN18729_c0_g1_i1.p1  ORF type:complete len:479 (-),score=97.70 TRINITY_DN18729_c0_g1_i1:15-1451(-)